MNIDRIRDYLRRDGWLLGALLACAALCLLLGSSTGTPTEEARISRVLSAMEGAGQVELAVYYAESVPCGAVVIAEGADSIAVQLRLTSAVSTLLGLDSSSVAVYPRAE